MKGIGFVEGLIRGDLFGSFSGHVICCKHVHVVATKKNKKNLKVCSRCGKVDTATNSRHAKQRTGMHLHYIVLIMSIACSHNNIGIDSYYCASSLWSFCVCRKYLRTTIGYICPYTHLPIRPSAHLPIRPSAHLPICPSNCLGVGRRPRRSPFS